ncbi:MAG: DUF4445 domain-containing protein [Clostridia bacterium]|nr:DUF4445 domain-containing protein [Clostridia bacterium]
MPVVTITFEDRTETLVCEKGKTIKAVLNSAGIYVDAPCGGKGKCGKCAVTASGELSLPTEEEKAASLEKGKRLACVTEILGDCHVSLGSGEQNIQVSLGSGEKKNRIFSHRVSGLGAAVDIGTTTVACRLFDLKAGVELGASGAVNLQRSFGADVISRIGACMESKEAAAAMTSAIVGQIKSMVGELCRKNGRDPGEVEALTIAGNTTMAHLFAGLDPSGLGTAPFTPVSLFGESYKCRIPELGLADEADIYIIPAPASFVGGDITAAALSCDMDLSGKTLLLIDIGTNGEIVLSHKGSLYCCATAAGPAFEGADISCGMCGTDGAIRGVSLADGGIKLEVIGEGEPKGICGSGLVDALAVMLELGSVEFTGRMLFPDEAEGLAAEMLDEDDLGDAVFCLDKNVRISSADIRKLQLAKAAIAAGVRTLMTRAGVEAEEVETLFIAGGFGNSIRVENAAAMGLIPAVLKDKAVSVGNAAAEGACDVLCSEGLWTRAEKLVKEMNYVELSGDPVFMEYYVEEMLFGDEEAF